MFKIVGWLRCDLPRSSLTPAQQLHIICDIKNFLRYVIQSYNLYNMYDLCVLIMRKSVFVLFETS